MSQILMFSKPWILFKTVIMSGEKWLWMGLMTMPLQSSPHILQTTPQPLTAMWRCFTTVYQSSVLRPFPVTTAHDVLNPDKWNDDLGTCEQQLSPVCKHAGPLYPAARQEATRAPSLSGDLRTTYKPSPMTESKSGEAVCVLPHLSTPVRDKRVCGGNSSLSNLVEIQKSDVMLINY